MTTTPAPDQPLNQEVKQKIDTFLALEERVARHTDSLQLVHRKAYIHAAETHLMDREGGLDYRKLRDKAIRDAFVESLTDVYVEAATAFWKRMGLSGSVITPPTDRLGRSLWVDDYIGMLGTELDRIVQELGEQYTIERHENQMIHSKESSVAKMSNKWLVNAINASGLRESDKEAIITYMHAHEFVDATKINFSDAISLLMRYRRKDRVLDAGDIREVRETAYKRPVLRAA